MRRTPVLLLAVTLAAAGCTGPSGGGEIPAPATSPAGPSASPTPPAEEDAAFERRLRRLLAVPPLPSFSVPTGLLSTPRNTGIAADLGVSPGLYEGIAVLDARCTEAGAAAAADASAPATGAQHYEDETVNISVAGDGTGVYDAPGVHVAVLPDGAGVYEDGETRLSIAADGSGTYRDGERRFSVRSDGTGSYEDDDVRVWMDATGAGGYEDDDVRISMSADGEVFGDAEPGQLAAVREVLADGLPLFPPVPAIAAVEPSGAVCGTVIRLDANVAFDFDSADVRPEGQAILERVATLLTALGNPRAQIEGHTDGIGEVDYNQDLSERRAAAVRDLLVGAGVDPDALGTRGLGETQPLRVETLPDGADDPAARQLNRRVEIVLLDE